MIYGFNENIGVEMFPTNSVETQKVSAGFAVMKQRNEYTKLRVIVGDHEIPAGAFVYVEGDTCKQKFATEPHEIAGEKVITMPKLFVKFVER